MIRMGSFRTDEFLFEELNRAGPKGIRSAVTSEFHRASGAGTDIGPSAVGGLMQGKDRRSER